MLLMPVAAKDWTQLYATSDISHHSLRPTYSIWGTKQPYDAFWNKLPNLEHAGSPYVIADSANSDTLVQPVVDSGHKSLAEAVDAPVVMTAVQTKDVATMTDDSMSNKTSCKSDTSGKAAHKPASNRWWPPACALLVLLKYLVCAISHGCLTSANQPEL